MLMQRPLLQVNWVRGKHVGYAVDRATVKRRPKANTQRSKQPVITAINSPTVLLRE